MSYRPPSPPPSPARTPRPPTRPRRLRAARRRPPTKLRPRLPPAAGGGDGEGSARCRSPAGRRAHAAGLSRRAGALRRSGDGDVAGATGGGCAGGACVPGPGASSGAGGGALRARGGCRGRVPQPCPTLRLGRRPRTLDARGKEPSSQNMAPPPPPPPAFCAHLPFASCPGQGTRPGPRAAGQCEHSRRRVGLRRGGCCRAGRRMPAACAWSMCLESFPALIVLTDWRGVGNRFQYSSLV